ncbi:MAG: type III-A CRISPR-associated protein Cas10/Csm1 [candidate division WOR-3 bacterium]
MARTVDTKGERLRIALGALFHDIGKVVQRADSNPNTKTHQEFGEEWIINNIKPLDLAKEIAVYARYHHTGTHRLELDASRLGRNDLVLVALSDNLSAGERGSLEKDTTFNPAQPLKSIFSSLDPGYRGIDKSGNGTVYEVPSVYWPLKPLTDGVIFPEKEISLTKNDYEKILKGIERSLAKIGNLDPDIVLSVMENFLTFVPSYTISEGTDISLYDHLKTTCAIALANYNFLLDKYPDQDFSSLSPDEILNTDENRYLLLIVDISGIQDFIYTVSSRGALKLLRAKSFYLEALLAFVAKKLIRSLNLYDTNVIFLGGGNVTLLVQNTESAKKTLENLINQINEDLWRDFGGKIYLNYYYTAFNGKTISGREIENIADVIQKVQSGLSREKLRKFSDRNMGDIFKPIDSSGFYECEVCGADITKEEFEKSRRCRICDRLTEVGRSVIKSRYIVYNPGYNVDFKNFVEFTLYGSERVYLANEKPKGEFVWVINPTEEELTHGTPIYLGNYPGEGKVFEAEESEREEKVIKYIGRELVGALRMDVDNLGLIFAKGFSRDKVSLSRLSTLSRFLNLFFKKYINIIAERTSLSSDFQSFSISPSVPIKSREVVIVYAGGDDLFILGAWNDLIELAFDIRNAFRRFVGGDHVTLSGGLAFGHTKFPVRMLAKYAGEAEDEAKNVSSDKNGLSLFNVVMNWSDWNMLLEKFLIPLVNEYFSYDPKELRFVAVEVDGKFFPRRGIYKLLEISKQAGKGLSIKPFVSLAYFIGRNRDLFKGKKFILGLLDLKNYNLLKNIKPALMWVDYLLR